MSWRPHNEGTLDLARERRVIEEVERARRCSSVKLSPALYKVDHALVRDKQVVAWAEIKVRHRKYPTLLLSAAKWWALQDLQVRSGKPSMLYIAWPDGLWELNLSATSISLPVEVGGNSRGQNGDVEPVVMIPASAFRRISTMVLTEGRG